MRKLQTLAAAGMLALAAGPSMAADEDAPLTKLITIDEAVKAAMETAPEGAVVVEAELHDSDWSQLWGEGEGDWIWDIELAVPNQEEYDVVVDATTGTVQEAAN